MKTLPSSIPTLAAGLLGSLLSMPAVSEQRCDTPAATLETAEGPIHWQAAPDKDWTAVPLGFQFCYGERIQTLEHRAALRLSNDTLVRLNKNSAIHFLPEKESFFVELVNGAAHFLSRTKKRFEVKAPYMNAAVDGTEFSVEAAENTNAVAVFEGDVSVRAGGRVAQLTQGQGTRTDASHALSPVERITLPNAAAWTLYYPALFTLRSASANIQAHVDSANYALALEQLQQSTHPTDLAFAASLELAQGGLDSARELLQQAKATDETSADVLATESLIEVVQGNVRSALETTAQLVTQSAQNVNALLAHSFALQANGQVEEALTYARRANQAAPASVPVKARYAELLLSNGQPDEAEKILKRALSQSPLHPRLNTLMGYIGLSQQDSRLAIQSFSNTLNQNPNSALAHFGMGLSDVLAGDLPQAREKMELAALLDPTNSLFRSYLGKTYLELNLPDWAQPQLELAKTFDPNDPTPWFYAADLQQQSNQWVQALAAVDRAIAKNDNRAIYRPRNMLQGDALVRGNNKQQILHKLDLTAAGQLTSGAAAAEAPDEFAAHQTAALAFTGGAYDRLVASEALRARLLKPITAPPLGVGLETPGLPAPGWLMPTKMAAHEHSNLYPTNGLSGFLALHGGEHDTQSASWQMQAAGERVSLDAGYLSTQTDGFTDNNDLDLRIGEVNLHYRPSNQLKLVLRGSSHEEDTGDLTNAIDGPLYSFSNRYNEEIDTASFGAVYEPNSNTQLIWHSDKLKKEALSRTSVNFINPTNGITRYREDVDLHQFLVSQKFDFMRLSVGGARQKMNKAGVDEFIPEIPGIGPTQLDEQARKTQLFTAVDLPVSKNVDTHWGLSYSKYHFEIESGDSARQDETDYVVAARWSHSPAFQIAGANWTSTADYLVNSATLKPAQIYGIPLVNDQVAFDRGKTSALAISGQLAKWQYSALTTDSRLNLAEVVSSTTGLGNIVNKQVKTDIHLLRPLSDRWLLHLRLFQINSKTPFVANANQVDRPKQLRTDIATAGVAVDPTAKLHVGLETQFVHQKSTYPALDDQGRTASDIETEDVLVWNAQASYKPWFPGPVLSLNLLNLTNERLSINQDFISPEQGNITSAQRKIIPYGRIALLGMQWSL